MTRRSVRAFELGLSIILGLSDRIANYCDTLWSKLQLGLSSLALP
jgi:hypothetical protein